MPIKSNRIALVTFIFAILSAIYIKQFIAPHWVEQSYVYDVSTNKAGVSSYIYKEQKVIIDSVVNYEDSPLNQQNLFINTRAPYRITWRCYCWLYYARTLRLN